MKILTISIAAYNMEDYLGDCLDSLMDERVIDDLEIIIVDDGSTDRTFEIAEEYASRYPDSIRVVHKENGGYGTTVNYSIQHAKGKYFRLLDADDWLDKEGLYKLVQQLKETDADVVVNPRYMAYEDRHLKLNKPWKFPGNTTIDIKELKTIIFIPVHTIVYSTEKLKQSGVRLSAHMLYTDVIYSNEPFACMRNILFLDYPLYYYRLGRAGQSVSRDSMIKHTQDSLEVTKRICKFYEHCKSEKNENKDYLLNAISIRYGSSIRRLLMHPITAKSLTQLKDFETEMKNISKDVYKNFVKTGKVGLVIGIMRKTFYLPYWLLKLIPGRFLYKA